MGQIFVAKRVCLHTCSWLGVGSCKTETTWDRRSRACRINNLIRNFSYIWRIKLSPSQTHAETDPHGRDPHTPGAKLDAGKNRLSLVMFGFSRALQEVGRVGTYGANKYTDVGWMEVPNGQQRYTDAMFRHLLKEATGEEYDSDTLLLHAAHAAWNALARLELQLRSREKEEERRTRNSAFDKELMGVSPYES